MQRTRFGLIALIFAMSAPVRAGEPSPAALAFFESKIRPVLIEHCYECHAADSKSVRGGLLLDSREGLLKGGDSGPAIVAGKPDESLLLSALRFEDYEMPPKGKLPEGVIRDFEQWIRDGAADPRKGGGAVASQRTIDIEAGRQFWAFQPLSQPVVPTSADARWNGCSIDRFVDAKRAAASLAPAPAADRLTLIRRATFDLWGLPPLPEDIAAFVNDPAPDDQAFAKVVDRLLASPHFGERWGRHWLDVARYADTTGGGRSMFFNAAWRYRDYVINSFNTDKPFDRFIVEQIAGDLLPYESFQQGQDQLTATAFLVLGPTNYEEQDKEQLRMDVIDEQIDTTGRAFLGMTIGCARCHDHKFDPIPTRDYYALAGIFRSTKTLIHDNVSTWVKRPVPLPPEQQAIIDAHAAEMASIQKQMTAMEPELKRLRAQLPLLTIDDDAALLEGVWNTGKGVKEFVGEGYRFARSEAPTTATYDFAGRIRNGKYDVRVSYCAHPNRSTDAVIEIHSAAGVEVVRVNQQASPGPDGLYHSLGTFPFRRNKPAKVVVVATNASGPVVADAVQLVPVEANLARGGQSLQHVVDDPASLPGVVVDNTAAEIVGAWTESVSVKSYVGAGYLHDDRTGKGEKKLVFRTDLPKSGEYDVRLAYNAADSRTSRATVRVTHRDGEAVITVNQQQQPDVDGLFHSLGRFSFTNDVAGVVTLSTEGSDDGYVIGDAVWFAPVGSADREAVPPAQVASSAGTDVQPETALMLAALESRHQQLVEELDRLKKSAPETPPMVLSIENEAEPADYCICIRGNVHQLGDPVPRSFLQVATTRDVAIPEKASGRLELAQWIASGDNPLTARVYVNRVWQKLFGHGIVRSVDNFGSPGDRPTHPELLDHLAGEFVADGWSTKRLIRRIMLSQTWRMSCERDPESRQKDPENQWLAGQNRRRLDAEALRDAVQLVGGQLDLTMAGDTVRPGTKSEYGYTFDEGRRSVYLPVLRNRLPDALAVFDFPDPNLSTGQRASSTLPTQALFLMNSEFIRSMAEATARKVLEVDGTDDERLEQFYLRALGRRPSPDERYAAVAYLPETPEGQDAVRRWTNLVQAVFASVDFRYID